MERGPDGRTNQLDILLIENDPAMAHLTKEAFREAGLYEQIVSLPNGEDALAYLRGERHYSHRPFPDIIFLDLHLPRKSGLETLSEIKSNPKLTAIPVVVVSGSADPGEVRRAYELHASCYVRKPDDLDSFLRFIQVCFLFWGSVATLPEKPDLTPASSR